MPGHVAAHVDGNGKSRNMGGIGLDAVSYTHLIGGWNHIAPVSGWRSQEEQQSIWNESTEENGADFTAKYVAQPGHSEHQTGLAIDLGLRREKLDFIRPSFPYSGICEIFRQKAARYGFIERYPAGKEDRCV